MKPRQDSVVTCQRHAPHSLRLSNPADPDAVLSAAFEASQPWYVAHTKPRQESVAVANLARQGYVVYLPRLRTLKHRLGRLESLHEPMFPRYLFFRPATVEQSIAPARSTLGVTNVVRFGQEPARLRQETLDRIRAAEIRQNAASDEAISPYQPGIAVRASDGPLVGLEGIIAGVSDERVIVLMHLLGHDTRVSMSPNQLQLAN